MKEFDLFNLIRRFVQMNPNLNFFGIIEDMQEVDGENAGVKLNDEYFWSRTYSQKENTLIQKEYPMVLIKEQNTVFSRKKTSILYEMYFLDILNNTEKCIPIDLSYVAVNKMRQAVESFLNFMDNIKVTNQGYFHVEDLAANHPTAVTDVSKTATFKTRFERDNDSVFGEIWSGGSSLNYGMKIGFRFAYDSCDLPTWDLEPKESITTAVQCC